MKNYIIRWYIKGNLVTEHFDKEETAFKRYNELFDKFGGHLDFEIAVYKIIRRHEN